MSNTHPIVDAVAPKATYAFSAATGVLAWFGTSHFAVLSTFIIAAVTAYITWYFKKQDNLRKQAEEARRQERHALDVAERKARIEHLNRTPNTILPPLCEVIEPDLDTDFKEIL